MKQLYIEVLKMGYNIEGYQDVVGEIETKATNFSA
jgi:hypothetical protein